MRYMLGVVVLATLLAGCVKQIVVITPPAIGMEMEQNKMLQEKLKIEEEKSAYYKFRNGKKEK